MSKLVATVPFEEGSVDAIFCGATKEEEVAQAKAFSLAARWLQSSNTETEALSTSFKALSIIGTSFKGSLPDELLLEIVRHLDFPDLLSCFHTSRKFREMALESLLDVTFYFYGTLKQIDKQWQWINAMLMKKVQIRRLALRFDKYDPLGILLLYKLHFDVQKARAASEWQSSTIGRELDFKLIEAFDYWSDEIALDYAVWSTVSQSERMKSLRWACSLFAWVGAEDEPRHSFSPKLKGTPMMNCRLDTLEISLEEQGDWELDRAFLDITKEARRLYFSMNLVRRNAGIIEVVLTAKDTLEELHLYGIMADEDFLSKFGEIGSLPVYFPMLKRLIIRGSYMTALTFQAPKLEYLRMQRGYVGKDMSRDFFRPLAENLRTLHIDVSSPDTLDYLVTELLFHLPLCVDLTIQFDGPQNLDEIDQPDRDDAPDCRSLWTVLIDQHQILPKLEEFTFYSEYCCEEGCEDCKDPLEYVKDEDLINFVKAREGAGVPLVSLNIEMRMWSRLKEETIAELGGLVQQLMKVKYHRESDIYPVEQWLYQGTLVEVTA